MRLRLVDWRVELGEERGKIVVVVVVAAVTGSPAAAAAGAPAASAALTRDAGPSASLTEERALLIDLRLDALKLVLNREHKIRLGAAVDADRALHRREARVHRSEALTPAERLEVHVQQL